ncbi:MAG: NAD(P)-dependent oxidoreductase [Pseudomonadota bacterium]
MATVFLTEPIHEDGVAVLRDAGATLHFGWELDPAARAAALAETEAIVARVEKIGAQVFAAAPKLKVISRHGVGCDSIDLPAAKAAGVTVAISAGANDTAVAEHTMALMLSAAKRVREMDAVTREDYRGRAGRMSADLKGRRMLVLGYGRIGRRVAPLCAAFGMDVILWDKALEPGQPVDGYPVARSLMHGLRGAGGVTVHVPLDDETRGMIGEDELRALAPGALVVNAARGGIIDEAALAKVAAEGHLGGVATDVYTVEPVEPDNPVLGVEHAILSPHTAAMSPESMRLMATIAAENALKGVAGTLPDGMVFQAG